MHFLAPPDRSNPINIRPAADQGSRLTSKTLRVIQRKPAVTMTGTAVIQRMPAGPGLEPDTFLMSEFGVVKIVAAVEGGYKVMLHDGSTRDLRYDQLQTSVTQEGEQWEFGMANPRKLLSIAEGVAEKKDSISEDNWVAELYQLLTSIVRQFTPGLPIPQLHPPEHLEAAADFFGELDANAQFDHRDWSVAISPKVFTQKKGEALAELAGDLYHEIRHAEQYFVAARILAKDFATSEDRPTATAEEFIDQELGLPAVICKLAVVSAEGWEPTEEEMSEAATLVNTLTTSLERGATTKLEMVRLREIEMDGGQIMGKITKVASDIEQIKAGKKPYHTLNARQKQQTIEYLQGEIRGHQKTLAELEQKRNVQEEKYNTLQAAYFNDPTEKDAAALGKGFTAEFGRLTGPMGDDHDPEGWKDDEGPAKKKSRWKPDGDKAGQGEKGDKGGPGGKGESARIEIGFMPIRQRDYDKVIGRIREELPLPNRQDGVTGTIYPGYTLSAAQIAALGGRRVLPTVPDGDCFINAVAESLGRPCDPRLVRANMANVARRENIINAEQGELMLQPGDWTLSHIGLTLLARSEQVRIRILRADGGYDEVGRDDAPNTIILVHIPGAIPHYYGTRQ